MNTSPQIFAIVVTFNRRLLLEKCINALLFQTSALERIVIVNNASTDNTHEWIYSSSLAQHPHITYHLSKENLGGAGGFAVGMQMAFAMGSDWVWMMDDDAEPQPDALEELLKVATNIQNVYGSLAVNGPDTAWATTLLEKDLNRVINLAAEIPEQAKVEFLPFLGFMIHCSLAEHIGLPDAGYFIAGDDVEYCSRALQSGSQLIIAGRSQISHPKSESYQVRVLVREFTCLKLPPWKRYYDTRNRILNAKKYYGLRLLTQTFPGLLVRLLAALWQEPRRAAQFWAFSAGFIDGLLGRKGRRHSFWGIS